MSDISTQADYSAACAKVVRLQKYLAELIKADALMGVATEAMQAVDDTIEGPDFEGAIVSVRLAIRTTQDDLDAFDGRYDWNDRGIAQRVFDKMGMI